jgi:hypothetical protein
VLALEVEGFLDAGEVCLAHRGALLANHGAMRSLLEDGNRRGFTDGSWIASCLVRRLRGSVGLGCTRAKTSHVPVVARSIGDGASNDGTLDGELDWSGVAENFGLCVYLEAGRQ